jgi:hypothetical protein
VCRNKNDTQAFIIFISFISFIIFILNHLCMKKIYLFAFIFLLASVIAEGQVKITTEQQTIIDPKSFSILEVESGKGGLRLPQLTTAEAEALFQTATPAQKAAAAGLVIYNTTVHSIQWWNNNSNGAWMDVSDTPCSPPAAVSITPNQTSFTEYGQDDLILTAHATGASNNADIYYTWYRDGDWVGVGKTFVVKNTELASKWAGEYTVAATGCIYATVGSVTSAGVPIQVQKPYNAPTAQPATVTVPYSPSAIHTVTVDLDEPVQGNDLSLRVLDDKDRMLESYTIALQTPKQYKINLTIRLSGNRADRSLTFLVSDGLGQQSAVVTVTQTPSGADGVVVGNYYLYSTLPGSAKTYVNAVNYARLLTWEEGYRASILTEEFLTDNAATLHAGIIPSGTYWLLGRSTADPLKGTISYDGGGLKLTKQTGNLTETANVLCIRRNN